MKTIIEPFRIKSVEPIQLSTKEKREFFLKASHYNVFYLHADDVTIDLLTDSGTGAMSSRQWGAVMEGDESYAGGKSFHFFEKTIQDIMGFEHVIPQFILRMNKNIKKPTDITKLKNVWEEKSTKKKKQND